MILNQPTRIRFRAVALFFVANMMNFSRAYFSVRSVLSKTLADRLDWEGLESRFCKLVILNERARQRLFCQKASENLSGLF